MSNGKGCDIIEVLDEGAQESKDTVKTIPQFLNEEQKALARTNIDVPSNADLFAEKAERIAIDEQMQKDIERASSSGGFLDEYDFGTTVPTQQQLTYYAMSKIPNVTDPVQIFNHTKIVNSFDMNTWDLTNTPNTEPPVFEWANIGRIGVSAATDSEKGIVKGSADNLKVKVNADGTMEVNGLPEKLDKIDTKADEDLENTNFITDCVLSAVNGIYDYSSGLSISILSGIEALISNKRNPNRTFKNIRFKKQNPSNILISGNAGDKITIFMDRLGNLFQALSDSVKKGTIAPEAYEYFKNLNTNIWQKKGAAGIHWTNGAGFSWTPYTGYPAGGTCVFNDRLYISLLGRYSGYSAYRTVSTQDGVNLSVVLANEPLSGMTVANGRMYCSKGVTFDVANFTPVTIPLTVVSQVIGAGKWFYCFDHINKVAKKTGDFVTYADIDYLLQFAGTTYTYSISGIDADNEGNTLATVLASNGAYSGILRFNDDDGSWVILTGNGTLTGKTFKNIRYGGGRWVSAVSGTTNQIFTTEETSIASDKAWVSKNIVGLTGIQTFAYGSGEWAFSYVPETVITSNDEFETFASKTTGMSGSANPTLNFANGFFFLTDYAYNSVIGVHSSNGRMNYYKPATKDTEVLITDILTCQISADGTYLTNILPKYPVDLLNMIDISQIVDRVSKLEAAVAAL